LAAYRLPNHAGQQKWASALFPDSVASGTIADTWPAATASSCTFCACTSASGLGEFAIGGAPAAWVAGRKTKRFRLLFLSTNTIPPGWGCVRGTFAMGRTDWLVDVANIGARWKVLKATTPTSRQNALT